MAQPKLPHGKHKQYELEQKYYLAGNPKIRRPQHVSATQPDRSLGSFVI
jgi:hypothetical protein